MRNVQFLCRGPFLVCWLAFAVSLASSDGIRVCAGNTNDRERSDKYVQTILDRAIPLLRLREVQDELELDSSQKSKLQANGMNTPPPTFDRSEWGTMDPQARHDATIQHQTNLREFFQQRRKQVKDVLSDAQLKRLTEISLQFRGISILQDPEVMRDLKITITQRQDILKRQMTFLRKLGQIDLSANENRQARQQMLDGFKDEMEVHVLAALDPEQQQKLDEMKGKPFPFPDRLREPGVLRKELYASSEKPKVAPVRPRNVDSSLQQELEAAIYDEEFERDE
ncbi:hypothetical protein [Crateriforma conspicua]|uniref:LTXXQ motif protein n=1 Tax=Crateriforma conspicua TaxID=2527996 RepID=A0A5C5Y4H8_9PLAN|nr:hypothetical protein [Crateriforma conspicua]QDV65153.1 hypothetical protein Mal65_43230 [Crateriforma conspicua]TWT70547.1 hypothetical protein Pan14r_28540 [Crateriforma conspicua]